MRNKLLCASVVAIVVSFSQQALADDPKPGTPNPMPSMQLSKELSLTPEQMTRLSTLQQEIRSKMTGLQTEFHSINDEINTISKSSPIDEAKLNALIDKKKEIVGVMMKNKAMLVHEIYTMLTPDQKSKFDEMVSNRAKMHNQTEMPIQQ